MKFDFLKFKTIGAIYLAALVFCCVAAVSAQKVEPSPAISQSSAQLTENKTENSENKTRERIVKTAKEELIHFGDVIDVDVLGSLEYDWRGQLDSEGFLSAIPYTKEPVFALCRSEEELAANLAEAFSKFLRKPEIIVRVVDRTARQQARIFGAVRTPLRFQIERPVRLNELLVVSGGIGERASGEIRIFRPANQSCNSLHEVQGESETQIVKISDLLSGKTEANPYVHTGDIITVEEAKPIYVIGGVAQPQPIFLRAGQTMTLSRAVASVGGAVKDLPKASIFRRLPDGGLKVIETDLEKIRKKQADDVALEAFDIVEISGTVSARADKSRPPSITGFESAAAMPANPPLKVIN